jgi:DNA-binding NarL/FixJ family response regulator
MASTQIITGGEKLTPNRFAEIPAINGRALPMGLSTRGRSVMILDRRALDGQCLARCLTSQKAEMEFIAVTSLDTWNSLKDDVLPLGAILLNIGGESAADPSVAEKVRSLSVEFGVPVILLADSLDLLQIMKALEFGAQGYIPSSVTIDVCIEAIALSLAGGVFLPASSVLAMRQMFETVTPPVRPLGSMFTARQIEVANALRRGKANKIIAYELDLHESTVKVHIRNIMKKMKATNRTEVAFKLNELFPHDS